MATVESFRNKPFDILEKMRNDTIMRQQLQDQAIARQYNQQKNELDLAQAQQDLEFSRQGLGKNVPATVAQMMYREKLNPSQRELFDKTIVRGSSGFKQINLGDSIGLYDANTGEIMARYPKGAGPKYITDALGNPVLLGGGGGGNFNMGNAPTAPTQGSIDDQLNNLGSMNPPTVPTQSSPLTPPTQGNVPTPATQGPNQRTLMGPRRLANGDIEYNGKIFASPIAAKAAYEADFAVQKEQDKVIAKEYADAFTNYTLTGPQAASEREQAVENLKNLHGKLGYAQSGLVGGKLPAYSTEAQQFEANTAILQTKNNPLKGEGTVSNFERELIARTVPSRSYRKETMQKAFEASKALKEIQSKKQEFVSNWQQQNGSWNAQGEIALKEYIQPIAREKFYALYPEEAGANAQQPTQNAEQPMMPAAGGFKYIGTE